MPMKAPGQDAPARKSLGQNFLVDKHIISRIIDSCSFSSDETVLEIGPGKGALTRLIMPLVREVIAIEADKSLAADLSAATDGSNLMVHHADILKFNLGKIPGKAKVVGNIPYNISSPIIARVLEERKRFTGCFVTTQLEFGQRLIAKPSSADRSSLSCFVQFYARPRMLFRIGSQAFRPAPKINSCLMQLELRDEPAVAVKDEALFNQVVRAAFAQRRKTMHNALAALWDKYIVGDVLTQAGVALKARAEDLDLEQFARIADRIEAYGKKDLLS
jgi:16S rRNA (adenine1518-N6/adenine1519-N6)-dimethyltransferase